MSINNHALSLALSACLLLLAADLHAEDLICDSGTVCELPPLVDGDVIVSNGSFVRVPRLRDFTTIITGDVIVSDSGRITFLDVFVGGDVLADGHRGVNLVDTVVEGDVEIQGQVDNRPSMTVSRSQFGGDVLITGNDAHRIGVSSCIINGELLVAENTLTLLLIVSRNEVGGSVLLLDNLVFEDDRVSVLRNTILGDLLCAGNDPDPVLNRNEVSGDVICED